MMRKYNSCEIILWYSHFSVVCSCFFPAISTASHQGASRTLDLPHKDHVIITSTGSLPEDCHSQLVLS